LASDSTSGFSSDSIITSSLILDIHFAKECIPVSWNQNFLPLTAMTLFDPTTTLVSSFDPTLIREDNPLDRLSFVYREKGERNLIPLAQYDGSTISSSIVYDWTPILNDGIYELFIQLNCRESYSLSDPIELIVDLTDFETFGVISPFEGFLEKKESVKILFNKELDCQQTILNVTYVQNSSLPLTFKKACNGPELEILLSEDSYLIVQGGDISFSIFPQSSTGYILNEQIFKFDTSNFFFFFFQLNK